MNHNSCRYIHSSTTIYQAKRQKDLFTPSPFTRSSRINVSDKFAIYRDLKEGHDNVYGVRRYLLLPRTEDDRYIDFNDENYTPKHVIASLNANRNVLFGAQLHIINSTKTTSDEECNLTTIANNNDDDEYISKYLAACGSLLDIAKEDASINGQQVQALATLNGLCAWVTECLEKDGEGSNVLLGLIHGTQPNKLLQKDQDIDKTSKEEGGKTKPPSGKRSNQRIMNYNTDTGPTLILKKESQRIQMLEAVRAIATGQPRPGHSVVGAGTYRDGMKGWVALAREYTQLATNPESITIDESYVRRKGLEELALYKSRNGEVTKIEHLAHTTPEYLMEAGGAMARLFFV